MRGKTWTKDEIEKEDKGIEETNGRLMQMIDSLLPRKSVLG